MKDTDLMIWDGQGPVLIGTYDPANGRADSGFLTNLYRVGCGTSVLSTSLSVEKKAIKETCSGQRLTLFERETAKELEIKLEMVQFSGKTLAAALYGKSAFVAAGTVTGEQLPQLQAGDYFTVRQPDISNLVIKDSTGTAITYVAGEHYEIEDAKQARLRLIKHPDNHTEPLLADYSYGEYTNIPTFTAQNVSRGIMFNGINSSGQRARIIVPRISLAMGGDFGWISDDEAKLQLSGKALVVPELSSDALYGGFMRVDLI